MKNLKRKGFTIVELVIVIAVIVILAAVLIPTFSSLIRRANVAQDTTVAKNMNTALATYSAENGNPETFEEVLIAIEEAGYVLANLNAKAEGNLYAWDEKNNQIVYISKEGEVIYQNEDFVNGDLRFVIANASIATPDWAEKENVVDMTKPTSVTFLKNVLSEGGSVELGDAIVITDDSAAARNIITNNTVLNFNDNTINLDIPNATGSTANWFGMRISSGEVTLDGTENGGIVTANNEQLYAIVIGETYSDAADINVTITGGKYIGGTTAISVTKGTLKIEGGFFQSQSDSKYTINCIDDNYDNGSAKIIVTGGTFVNFNPANNITEGAGTNYVAAGYKVVQEVHGNDTWYIVVPE